MLFRNFASPKAGGGCCGVHSSNCSEHFKEPEMKVRAKSVAVLIFCFQMGAGCQEAPSVGLTNQLGDIYRLSNAKSFSISPENPTGAKGKGGMATDGSGAKAARDLG